MNAARVAALAARLQAALVACCAAYIAFVQTSGITFVRSASFAAMAGVLLVAVLQRHPPGSARIAHGERWLVLPQFAWIAWSALSLAWSRDPHYSLDEILTEGLAGFVTFVAFLHAARQPRGFRSIVGALLGMSALMAAVALATALAGGFDAALAHHGVGGYSTHLVMVAPFALLLLARGPEGLALGRRQRLACALLVLLLLIAARLTANRMLWPALMAEVIVATLALHCAQADVRRRRRLALVSVACLAICVAGFFHAAQERVLQLSLTLPLPSVSQTFVDDPRLRLWTLAFERIAAHPWIGYGYGRGILAADFATSLHDPLLTHAHNVFISQWLQSGAVGLLLLVLALGALAWRFLRFVRSQDRRLALAGVIGLALLAGFVVKNFTDDFLFRNNARELWAMLGMLAGFGLAREREVGAPAAVPLPAVERLRAEAAVATVAVEPVLATPRRA